MAINLTTRYESKIDERFSQGSITDSFAGHEYDFAGARTIKVYSVDPVPVVDYTREGTMRYGILNELGDTLQEMTMSQDKGFTFSVDAGNAADQINIKQVSKRLKVNWDVVATPLIDKYRLRHWMDGAGQGTCSEEELNRTNAMEAVMNGTVALSNALVPLKDRVLFIKETVYIAVKLSNELVGVDTLGEQAIKNGVVGYLDGMQVVRVPDSYFPEGVNFLIKYKTASADPMKLKSLRVQKSPLGIDGDVGECRFYYDSFVLDNKINGIYVHTTEGLEPPEISVSGETAEIEAPVGGNIKYTTDGSNPKTSPTAETYTDAISGLADGDCVRAYCFADDYVNSPVSEFII